MTADQERQFRNRQLFAGCDLQTTAICHLHDTEISLALAGYRLPGFFFGSVIGRWARRYTGGVAIRVLASKLRGGLACDCPHIRHGKMRHDLSSPELRYEVEVSNRLTKFLLWIKSNN
jgi:hypothetical protein